MRRSCECLRMPTSLHKPQDLFFSAGQRTHLLSIIRRQLFPPKPRRKKHLFHPEVAVVREALPVIDMLREDPEQPGVVRADCPGVAGCRVAGVIAEPDIGYEAFTLYCYRLYKPGRAIALYALRRAYHRTEKHQNSACPIFSLNYMISESLSTSTGPDMMRTWAYPLSTSRVRDTRLE